ncbi:MAG: hypothetical protein ACFFDD_11705 [Promethearchaeota archaeon]
MKYKLIFGSIAPVETMKNEKKLPDISKKMIIRILCSLEPLIQMRLGI